MCGIDFPTDPNLMVGLDKADDAGVYRISDELAIIQTVDFFTPIVDDPYSFGQIAVANALSDIYAMGGKPKTAMNLVAFPLKSMDISVLRLIIQGGLDKMKEADVVLVGGHSIEDDELKYGLSVTGFIHPDKVLTKQNIKPGDHLILTKPLGTGVINTAIKGKFASEDIIDKITRLMSTLNQKAADVMNNYSIHACTDITGFGLLGHLAEMVRGSGNGMILNSSAIPIIPETFDYASMGMVPAGAFNNREFRKDMVDFSQNLNKLLQDILFDPQTSGGLLICADKSDSDSLVNHLKNEGMEESAVIGEVSSSLGERIVVE